MTTNASNSSAPITQLAPQTEPNGFGISAENMADINQRFAEIDARVKASDMHPTQTVRGSTMIHHADGTWSHFSYRRPATVREAENASSASAGRRAGVAKRGDVVEHSAGNGRMWVGGRPVPTPRWHVRLWRGLKSLFA